MRLIIANLGGFQMGYAIGIMAGAILFIAPELTLSTQMTSWAVSAFLIGTLPGSVVAGRMSNRLGRKKVQQLVAFLFLIGSLILFLSDSLSEIVIGRIIQGIAAGAITVVGPLYLAEISSAEKRGFYVGTYQLAVVTGILFAYAINLVFAFTGNWHWMFALGVIPAVFHLVGFHFLPDTTPSVTPKFTWQGMKKSALAIAIFLNVFQQVTGVNAIIYFAPSIFLHAGFNTPILALLPPLLIGIVNVGLTGLSLMLLDKMGRKPLLLAGVAGMALSLFALGFGFYFGSDYMKWLATVAILVYIGSFALSLGPIPPVISAEMFPYATRGQAMSVALCSNWAFNFLVVYTFLDFATKYSQGIVFGAYGLLALLAFGVVWKFIPETKGIALD